MLDINNNNNIHKNVEIIEAKVAEAANAATKILLKWDLNFLPLVLYSFVFFSVVYRFLVPFLSNKLTNSYNSKLTFQQKLEWNVR
jgi:hypothetical protein